MENRIKLGVSACLLGENVRWNGGHARDRFITDILSQYVDFVPVCPEVEAGFPVPRETFRLIGDPENPGMFAKTPVAGLPLRRFRPPRPVLVTTERFGPFERPRPRPPRSRSSARSKAGRWLSCEADWRFRNVSSTSGYPPAATIKRS